VLYLVLGACSSFQATRPVFDTQAGQDSSLRYTYAFTPADSAYLRSFAQEYDLPERVRGAETELEWLYRISSWVHGLWRHHRSNAPSTNDPAAILEAVQEGERFRCVEYARVIHGALSSLGLQSRIVSLYRASPESTTKSHVVVEAYLPETGTWVFVDGQWNAIPVLDGEPLNAVELQRAVARNAAGLSFYGQGSMRLYQRWIDDYLVYLSFNPDSRVGITRFRSKNIMLVPENLPVPRYATAWHAERNYRLERSTRVVRSTRLFYRAPE
jgi:hypothetical protein